MSDEARTLVETLRRELRDTRRALDEMQSRVEREHSDPPPWAQALIKDHERRLAKIERTLDGNGRTGLVAEVAILKNDAIEGEAKDARRITVSTRLVVALVGLIGAIVVALIKVFGEGFFR